MIDYKMIFLWVLLFKKMIAIDIKLYEKNEKKLIFKSFNISLMGTNFALKNVSTS